MAQFISSKQLSKNPVFIKLLLLLNTFVLFLQLHKNRKVAGLNPNGHLAGWEFNFTTGLPKTFELKLKTEHNVEISISCERCLLDSGPELVMG